MLDVDLDGLLGDEEPLRDVLVAVAFRNVPEDLYFARRERLVAQVLGECAATAGGMRFLPAWTWRIASISSPGGMVLSR